MMKLEQQLRNRFLKEHPLEAARYLEGLPAQNTRDILQTMDPECVAQTLEYFLPGATANILKELPPETTAEILSRLTPGSTRAILRQFDSSTQERLLGHLAPHTAAFLRRTIPLAAHTAGSLADPQVLTLPPDITVGEALLRIMQVPHQAIYYLYIIDHRNILDGVVLMKELLVAQPTSTLASIMIQDVKVIPASANAIDIVAHHAWALFDSLPVIDQDKTFIGALRHRALRQFLQSTSTEYQPAFLSDSLLQLWEAYSLSGMVLMTTMGDLLTTSTAPVPNREEQETP
jgi:magnesium transporter